MNRNAAVSKDWVSPEFPEQATVSKSHLQRPPLRGARLPSSDHTANRNSTPKQNRPFSSEKIVLRRKRRCLRTKCRRLTARTLVSPRKVPFPPVNSPAHRCPSSCFD